MPEPTIPSSPKASPDYVGLVRFLTEPLLERPDSLKINCEQANGSKRVWIRVAFEEADRGRVFGRSGRNIQAIRTLLDTAAKGAGQSIYLDIYGSGERNSNGSEDKSKGKRPRPRRSSAAKPAVRSRSR